MQLQNKETKIKYSIILEDEEMNALISALDRLRGLGGQYIQDREILESLVAFRGKENEPTMTTRPGPSTFDTPAAIV